MSRRTSLLVVTVLLALGATGAQAQLLGAPPPRRPLEITLDLHNARVLSVREGVIPPERMVSLAGVAASYRLPGGRYDVAVRLRKSTLAGDLAFGDAAVSRRFGALGAEVGFGWRRGYDAASGALHGATHTFVRIGGGWRDVIDATPLTLEARLGAYLPTGPAALPGGALSGWDGESSVRVAIGATAFDALVGYRFERFAVDRLVQEVSLLRGGVVWRWGAP